MFMQEGTSTPLEAFWERQQVAFSSVFVLQFLILVMLYYSNTGALGLAQ
jgi:hypothetical protein